MIQHWLSDKGLKAIQIMPLIEWEKGGTRFCLMQTTRKGSDDILWEQWMLIPARGKEPEQMSVVRELHPHVALCLLQHQARIHLKACGIHICLSDCDNYVGQKIGQGNWPTDIAPRSPDYDEASIDAVLSTEKK